MKRHGIRASFAIFSLNPSQKTSKWRPCSNDQTLHLSKLKLRKYPSHRLMQNSQHRPVTEWFKGVDACNSGAFNFDLSPTLTKSSLSLQVPQGFSFQAPRGPPSPSCATQNIAHLLKENVLLPAPPLHRQSQKTISV